MLKRLVLFLSLVTLHTGYCLADSPQIFMKAAPYARAAGMAEAYVSLSDGTYGLFYNPAGIPSVMGFEAQVSWVSWLQSVQSGHIALISPFSILDKGRIGISFAWSYADRQSAGGYIFPVDWSIYPATAGYISNVYAVLGAGFEFIPEFSAGINLKMVYDYINDGTSGFNYGMDIGVLAKFTMPGHMLRMGAVASNYGHELLSQKVGFDPPAKITVGISDDFDFINDRTLLISAETSFSTNTTALFKIGFEYWIFDFLSLRVGEKIAAFNHPTFGVGFKAGGTEINYAYEGYETQGRVHNVSALFTWGTPFVNLTTEHKLISPNRDGVLETAALNIEISEPAKATKVFINVYYNGKKVNVIPIGNRSVKYAEWNGKIKGRNAKDGKYFLEMEVVYGKSGSAKSKQCEVKIDTVPPSLMLERDPAKMTLMGPQLSLLSACDDENAIKEWRFRVYDEEGHDVYVQKGSGTVPEEMEWGTKSKGAKPAKSNCSYFYTLSAVDAAGNRSETEPQEYIYSMANKEAAMTFSSDALFEPGKAGVKTSAYRTLKQIKKKMKSYPGAEIVIFGHTDNKEPAGGYETRLKLSKARANAVKFYMENLLGVKKRIILTQGLGHTLPVADNKTEAGRSKNRRVEVIFQTQGHK